MSSRIAKGLGRLATVVVFGTVGAPVVGEDASIAALPLDIEQWTVDEGLPQTSVNGIAETPDGHLWLATNGGLVRYDGLDFEVFDLASTPEFVSNRLATVFLDRRGALWIGAYADGVTRYADGRFTHYAVEHGAPRGSVHDFVEDGDGVVWAQGADLARFVGDRFEVVTLPEGASPGWMLSTPDGAWVGTKKGTYRLAADGVRPAADPERVGRARDDHAVRMIRRRIVRVTSAGILEPEVWRIIERLREEPWSHDVRAVHVDRNGQVWCGTDLYGLFRARPAVLASVELGHEYHGCQFVPDGAGGVWIAPGRDDGLLHSVDGRIVERLLGDPARPMRWVLGLARGRDGRLWARHDRWVTETRGGRFVVHDLGVGSGDTSPMVEDRAGAIWCGQGLRLVRLDGDGVRRFGAPDGLDTTRRISGLGVDADGALWVGSDAVVYRWSGEQFTRFDADDGVPRGFVRTFCAASDGSFWIGTYGGGLARLVDGRFVQYGTSDGLPDNAISCILEDRRGTLWINGNHGAFSIGLETLAKHVPGVSPELPVRLVDSAEARGIGGCFVGETVVFPTIRGLVAIDTVRALAPRGSAPVASIRRVRAGGSPVDVRATLEIASDRRDLEIGFTAPDLRDARGVRFRHRLIGYDDAWVEAGARRRANYTKVHPGAYAFEVVATDSHGRSSAPAIVRFEVASFFYETAWFRTLVVAALVGTAWGTYRIRVRAVNRRNRELQREIGERQWVEGELRRSRGALRVLSRRLLTAQDEERRGIARELHDDFTQRLAALSIQAELLGARMETGADRDRQQMRDLAHMAQRLATDVQQLSRRLHPSSLRDLGLERAMRSECEAFSQREGVAVAFEADAVPEGLSPDITLAVFRILQESLHNVEKHARATQIEVKLIATNGELDVAIADTGCGFESDDRVANGSASAGVGLISMHERAIAVGGRLTVDSRPGSGTTVRLQVPVTESAG